MSSPYGALFNHVELQGQGGASVAASSLDGKVVGLYFSAHWCPPCRGFTPELVKSYNTLKASGKDIEIVFVSSDKNETAFQEYFAEHAWLALPFAERGLKASLSKQFGVQGIPSLVFLDGAGKVITKNGRESVSSDPAGANFPWKPKSVAELLGDSFVKGSTTITAESLHGKTVGLYFSAHWCGPCRGFTPVLAELYKKLEAADKPFEIIFVSSDRDEKSFDEYRASMPWVALPFSRREEKEQLSKKFQVRGIPTFIILESLESGAVLNGSGRAAVSADPEGVDFPWYPKSLNDMSEKTDGLNEEVCVIALLDGVEAATAATSAAALGTVADREYAAARATGVYHAEMRYFFSKEADGTSAQIRKLTGAAGPTLLILDIPDNGGFYAQPLAGGVLTAEAVDAFAAAYKAKTLERQQLKS